MEKKPEVADVLTTLRKTYADLKEVLSIDLLADGRILIVTAYGSIPFSVGKTEDGRLLLTESPAPLMSQ